MEPKYLEIWDKKDDFPTDLNQLINRLIEIKNNYEKTYDNLELIISIEENYKYKTPYIEFTLTGTDKIFP